MVTMKSSALGVVAGLLLVTAATAYARQNIAEAVSGQAHAASLLTKRTVQLYSTGRAALAYHVAIRMIEEDDILGALQEAYARMLPEGESPEFTVQQTAPRTYAYVNRDGEHTEIIEIHRVTKPEHVELYLYSTGNRFFGSFEALTAIRVKPADANEVDWEVAVYAYPQNILSRLVARTGVVNRFFRRKTNEITAIAVRIGTYMTTQAHVLSHTL